MEYLHHLLGSLPPWAYIAIIGGGVAAAFILPKYFNGSNSNASPTTASGNVSDAIDPNTGLPYPLSGYPGGAFAGNTGQTTGSASDTSALLSVLQTIASRLSPSPASGGSGSSTIGATVSSAAGGHTTTSTASPSTTSPMTALTDRQVGQPTRTGGAVGASEVNTAGALKESAPATPHVSAQPAKESIAGGNAVELATERQRVIASSRLTQAGV